MQKIDRLASHMQRIAVMVIFLTGGVAVSLDLGQSIHPSWFGIVIGILCAGGVIGTAVDLVPMLWPRGDRHGA